MNAYFSIFNGIYGMHILWGFILAYLRRISHENHKILVSCGTNIHKFVPFETEILQISRKIHLIYGYMKPGRDLH